MKVAVLEIPQKFKPYQVVIDIETIDEARLLKGFLVLDETMGGEGTDDLLQGDEIENDMLETFKALSHAIQTDHYTKMGMNK